MVNIRDLARRIDQLEARLSKTEQYLLIQKPDGQLYSGGKLFEMPENEGEQGVKYVILSLRYESEPSENFSESEGDFTSENFSIQDKKKGRALDKVSNVVGMSPTNGLVRIRYIGENSEILNGRLWSKGEEETLCANLAERLKSSRPKLFEIL